MKRRATVVAGMWGTMRSTASNVFHFVSEAALARKRRDDVIRAGGHVYETPPLAKDITMATPAE